MPNLNKVMLMGNLTRDPQLSYLPSQTAVCDIGLAINRTWTAPDGQRKEDVTFVDCSMFGKRAEVMAKYLKKGNPLFIEGRLKYDQWEAQDGTKRSKIRVVIDNFEFISSGQRTAGPSAEGDGSEQPASQPRPAAANRPPMRQPGRPAAAPIPTAPAAPTAEADPIPPDEEAPPIKDDDIPF